MPSCTHSRLSSNADASGQVRFKLRRNDVSSDLFSTQPGTKSSVSATASGESVGGGVLVGRGVTVAAGVPVGTDVAVGGGDGAAVAACACVGLGTAVGAGSSMGAGVARGRADVGEASPNAGVAVGVGSSVGVGVARGAVVGGGARVQPTAAARVAAMRRPARGVFTFTLGFPDESLTGCVQ